MLSQTQSITPLAANPLEQRFAFRAGEALCAWTASPISMVLDSEVIENG